MANVRKVRLSLNDEFWLESMQLAALFRRFEATGSSITSEKVPTLGMYCFSTRALQEQLTTRMPLSYFADMGTKKEPVVVTWSHEELYTRIVKAKSLRWDISRGERDSNSYTLLAAFVDPRFKKDAIWVQRENQQKTDSFNLISSRLSGWNT
jgi:hypothetical protein